MLSDGVFRGAHIFKGCSRHSSLKEWLSPSSSCDIRSVRRDVESFPSDISEQPKKVGEFIEVKPDLDYVRKVRCYLVSTHFIIAREKIYRHSEDRRRFEVDTLLKLSEHTFYFSGEVLVVEPRMGSDSRRYFELCDDSSVSIWKLLFRQSACLGPDSMDCSEDSTHSLDSKHTLISLVDEGHLDTPDDLPSALSPPAFFFSPLERKINSSSMMDDIATRLDRSGQKGLMKSKHLCCSENCLLDISHSDEFLGKRRRISSCVPVRSEEEDGVSGKSEDIGGGLAEGSKKRVVFLKSVQKSFYKKLLPGGGGTGSCRKSVDDMTLRSTPSYPLSTKESYSSANSFQRSLQLGVYNIKPEHFAQQLTYLDQRYLLAMSPRELLYCEHVMEESCRDLPNIRQAVSFFNRISMLSAQLVLLETTPRARARLIRYLISVAEKLRQMGNYSSLRAIIAGLQSNPIYRLENTWKLIKGQSRKTFNSLVEIWRHTNNYENYQTILEKGLQRGFIIPFLGLFFNQVLMTSLILKELKINELDLYPEEIEGPWNESFTVHDVSECPSCQEHVWQGGSGEDDDDLISMDLALDSICITPCLPTTPSSLSRKLKRLRKKPLNAGEVGTLPAVEHVLGPITRTLAESHPKTKVLQIQYLPPYLLRRYQLAASQQVLVDRPAVQYFLYKEHILSDGELRSLSMQRES